jgi:choline dehydrogenase
LSSPTERFNTDVDNSDGAEHTPFRGVNVERALDNDTTTTSLEAYEYVIVGSGAGGAPLAARLAMAGYKVLILEAGDDQTNTTEYNVPVLHSVAAEYEPMRWDYFVKHFDDEEEMRKDSKLTYELPDGSRYTGLSPPPDAKPLGVLYPRVGSFGGCTSHNALITLYPFDSDWKRIQDMTGDDSWAPNNMRKYYERLEKSRYVPNGIAGHGFKGWLETSLADLTLTIKDRKMLSLIVSAGKAMGKTIPSSVLTTVSGIAQYLIQDINYLGASRDSAEGKYVIKVVSIPANCSFRHLASSDGNEESRQKTFWTCRPPS